MSGVAQVVGMVVDAGVTEVTRGIKRALTSTGGNGGQTPNKRSNGAIEANRYNTKAPRELGVHAKAHAAYSMVQDLMPRMKQTSFMMYNHHHQLNAEPSRLFSGNDGHNTATLLYDRADTGSESVYFVRSDVIPSGLSMTMRHSAKDMSNMHESAIFPLSHPALITKGDGFYQRLGDFVKISGLHITGRIQCETFYPMHGENPAPHTAYVPSADQATLKSKPRSSRMDPQRKVRFMLIETFDNAEQAGVSETDDQTYYGNATWSEVKNNNGSISTIQKMKIVGAPRLENILDLDGIDTNVTPMRTRASIREVAENGRWKLIDRKYRSNHKNENIWLDPTTARRVPFKVHMDNSFTLTPSAIRKRVDDVDDIKQGFNRHSYQDLDIFIKLNADMSYPLASAGQNMSDEDWRGSRNFYFYLFSDHVDSLTSTGQSNPTTATDGTDMLDEIIQVGYPMCTAQLKLDVFFTDDL